MKLIDIIAGARPNFIKIAAIIEALDKKVDEKTLSYRLIHTGQHYDENMSAVFFEQLKIPKPSHNLGVGSGTQANQTAEIMIKYEKILSQKISNLCLVVGDVNSTMACAIVAKKMGVAVSHVEAGIRSGDLRMPEEINRIVTDSITDIFFTTSESANINLLNIGVSKKNIYLVGNTMIDTLYKNINSFKEPEIWNEANLTKKKYILLTLHRPSNVDCQEKLIKLLDNLSLYSKGMDIIFPVHPRTLSSLKNFKKINKNINIIKPLPYLEFNFLARNAKCIITDSGGVSEEATIFKVPCMTLRDSTERPETVEIGTNILIGDNNPKIIKKYLEILFQEKWKKGKIPEFWDGNSGDRIVRVLEKII